MSGVIRCLEHFGSPIKEKVSDLRSLEGVEMYGFEVWRGCLVKGLGRLRNLGWQEDCRTEQ